MKNFASLLDSCRTVHAFEENSVREEDLLEALEQCLKAPNHKFTFPWKFVWASAEDRERLAALSIELKRGDKHVDSETLNTMKSKILNPELVVMCQEISDDKFQAYDSFQLKEDYATMSCSVQLLALSLAEKGIGYKWSTGKVTRNSRAYEILSVNARRHEIVGFIYVGKALNTPKPRRRPLISDVLVRRDKV